MIDDRTKMLVETVRKLFRRGATPNIQRILQKSHNADIAAMLDGLAPDERFEVFNMVRSAEKRAAILSYLEEGNQKNLLEHLQKEEVLNLVSLMASDDAADLLGNLSEEESKEILASMVKEDSEEVADLLGYPEDSAGGLMSSDFFAFAQEQTVAGAIQAIQNDEEDRVAFYIYVMDDNEQLVGVVSLKQLLLSKTSALLKDLMQPDVISVSVDTDQERVAKTVERYDFLSLPVVDGNNVLKGVITVDDVLDVIREEAEGDLMAMGQAGWGGNVSTFDHFKSRIPWLVLAFLGGSLCFAIVYLFGHFDQPQAQLGVLWMVAAFIPLLLSLASTTGSQAATVAVGAIRAGRMDMGKVKDHLFKEFKLGVVFAVVFGVLVYLSGRMMFSAYDLSFIMASAMFVQILISMAVGSVTPIMMYKVGMDPTVGSVPLLTAIVDVSAVAVLFGLVVMGTQ